MLFVSDALNFLVPKQIGQKQHFRFFVRKRKTAKILAKKRIWAGFTLPLDIVTKLNEAAFTPDTESAAL